jgi:hypothetical protein
MPGFFDVFFGQPEPEPPKPKKAKDEGSTLIEKLEAEIVELREMVTTPEPEPEPEPVVEAEEPDDDESS